MGRGRGTRKTYSDRSPDVLGKEDALRLDDEEVDELVDVAKERIQCLPGNGIVLSGAELGGEARVQQGLTRDLGGHSDTQDHPGELEAPSEHVQVPNQEDGADDGNIGDGGSSYDLVSKIDITPFPPSSRYFSITTRPVLGVEGYKRWVTYGGSSRTRARRRTSGNVSGVGRWQRGGPGSDERQRGWRTRRRSSLAVP